ncbi:MAG: sugar ABC transporter permease [Sphaerochaetaceae bacterium]|nr:sugar ABC transporter permease [Sphaerochaetaceae bacterium]
MTSKPGAMFVLILASVWAGTGGTMIIFMAGLENISKTYYEAAEVDGASRSQQFFRITLPLLRPTLFLVLITGIIGVFKTYAMTMQLTKGGPGDATKFVVQNIYDTAFSRGQLGYACTQSLILTLIIATFTVIQFIVNKGGAVDDK